MSNENASRANDALLRHIQEAQSTATRLHGVLCAIDHLDNEGQCADGMTALIHIGREIADKLQCDLDTVNLPEVKANG